MKINKALSNITILTMAALMTSCAAYKPKSVKYRFQKEIKDYNKEIKDEWKSDPFSGIVATAFAPIIYVAVAPVRAVAAPIIDPTFNALDGAIAAVDESVGIENMMHSVSSAAIRTHAQTAEIEARYPISQQHDYNLTNTIQPRSATDDKTKKKISSKVETKNNPRTNSVNESPLLESQKRKVTNHHQLKQNTEKSTATHGLAITWQNDKGHWFAEGPLQKALGWNGYKTESEALKHASGSGRSTHYIKQTNINIPYSASAGRRRCNVYRVAIDVDWKTKQAYTNKYNIRLKYPQLKGW